MSGGRVSDYFISVVTEKPGLGGLYVSIPRRPEDELPLWLW